MSSQDIRAQRDLRAQAGLRASLIGLAANVMLAATKIMAGLLSGAVSILADGVNNLSDAGSVIVSMLSLRMARKPQDADHPFGHARIEYIGALAIGVIILYIGIDLMKRSVIAIRAPEMPAFSWLLAGVTALGIPVKSLMYRLYRKTAVKHDFPPLMATAQDSLNDVIITSAVLAGLLVSHFLGVILDGWLGVLVSGFVLFSGIRMIKGTVNDLIGGKPDRELGSRVLEILKGYPEILGLHDFVLHNYGPGRSMASVHAEVSTDTPILEIHEVIDLAEQEVLSKLDLPLLIHMDPVVPDDAPGQGRKARIAKFLSEMNPPLTLHDFRMVPGKRVIKLIFDVVVPVDFSGEEALIKKVEAFAKTLDPRHQCVIRIDRDYFPNEGQEDGE